MRRIREEVVIIAIFGLFWMSEFIPPMPSTCDVSFFNWGCREKFQVLPLFSGCSVSGHTAPPLYHNHPLLLL